MADISASIEFSSSYCNMNRFDSGKLGISFDCTGDTQKAIVGKDPTCIGGHESFYIEYVQLGCTTTSARIYDGSAGSFLFGILASDVSGVGSNSQTWDLRGDPLRCLTADNTQSICLSSGDGMVNGFIKGYWG